METGWPKFLPGLNILEPYCVFLIFIAYINCYQENINLFLEIIRVRSRMFRMQKWQIYYYDSCSSTQIRITLAY